MRSIPLRLNFRWPFRLKAAFAGCAVLFATFVWWYAERVDRIQRDEFARQVGVASKTIDLSHVLALSGRRDDLYNPHFRQLREQLATIRAIDTHQRFAYLLGRKEVESGGSRSRAFFFFADSEPIDSPDYSPPGEEYAHASPALSRLFDTPRAFVEGPADDRSGKWVSAFVPLVDPATGATICVLGVDVSAGHWRWRVAWPVALPSALVFCALFGLVLFAAVLSQQDSVESRESCPRPVLRRLLLPMAGLFALLLACMSLVLWLQQRHHLDTVGMLVNVDIDRTTRAAFEQETGWLGSEMQGLASSPAFAAALRARDKAELQRRVSPAMQRLLAHASLVQVSCRDAGGATVLRSRLAAGAHECAEADPPSAHDPRALREADGLWLSDSSLLVLRAVKPVLDGDANVGGVEVESEIAGPVNAMRLWHDVRLLVLLNKERLDRPKWESAMRRLGRPADWDLMSHHVVAYATGPSVSAALAGACAKTISGGPRAGASCQIVDRGRILRLTAFSLQDAACREVGSLIAVRDLTSDAASFGRLLAISGAISGVVLAILLVITYVLLSRTDARIRLQQASLQRSEERLVKLAEQSGTVAWEIDAAGCFTYVSYIAEQVWGYRPDELVGGRSLHDLHPEGGREAFRAEVHGLLASGKPIYNLVSQVQRKDGRCIWVSSSGLPLLSANGACTGCGGSSTEITERKRAEDALVKSAVELRCMASRLQDIREEERAALARELHDSLGQQLTAFALQFELMCMDGQELASQSRELADLYDRLVAMVPQIEGVTALTQKICASLKPVVLDELGLVSAIEAQVEEVAARGRLGYTLALPATDVELARNVSLALFRIVQEALANVLRHASARHITVGLREEAGFWVLEVKDDGCGFDMSAEGKAKSVGLIGMRERADAVGGTLSVLSAPGKGACVCVRVPVADARPAGRSNDEDIACG